MVTVVRLSDAIVVDEKKVSKTLNRLLDEQIEHWVTIGRLMEENPDLTYGFVKDILLAREEGKSATLEPYRLSKGRV
jgi:hypothetical protein